MGDVGRSVSFDVDVDSATETVDEDTRGHKSLNTETGTNHIGLSWNIVFHNNSKVWLSGINGYEISRYGLV